MLLHYVHYRLAEYMIDLTPLQVTAIYYMEKLINDEKQKAYGKSSNVKNNVYTIEEYRNRKSGKDLYTIPATPEQCANWERIKERLSHNPIKVKQ